MIIDCHCHAVWNDVLTPWNVEAPLDAYLRRARASGIDKTVVFAAVDTGCTGANAEVARIVARHSKRLIGFAYVHATRDAGSIFGLVKHCVVKFGFRGIKMHALNAMPTREVCEVARAFKLPLLVDIAEQAPIVDRFASKYPSVNFIIPHLGSFADNWRVQQQVVDQLVRYPNVYADTSGVRRFDFIVQAVERAGPRKLLFGSDGPWLHPGIELHKIQVLGLPGKKEALIMGGNAARLIHRPSVETPSIISSPTPFSMKRSETDTEAWTDLPSDQ